MCIRDSTKAVRMVQQPHLGSSICVKAAAVMAVPMAVRTRRVCKQENARNCAWCTWCRPQVRRSIGVITRQCNRKSRAPAAPARSGPRALIFRIKAQPDWRRNCRENILHTLHSAACVIALLRSSSRMVIHGGICSLLVGQALYYRISQPLRGLPLL